MWEWTKPVDEKAYKSFAVTVAPRLLLSTLIFVYDNPTATGESKNTKLAAL